MRIPFIEKASMAVDCFVGCVRRSGRICYHDLWYLVRTIFPPSHYSRGIHCAAGGSSQTSKILNLPLGDNGVPFGLTVNDLSCILRLSSIYAPIYYWSGSSPSVWMISKMSKSMGNWRHSLVIDNDTSSISGDIRQESWSNDWRRSALVNEAGLDFLTACELESLTFSQNFKTASGVTFLKYYRNFR